MAYLDYNATTPLAPVAFEAMVPYLTGAYGNPSSIHTAGRAARAGLDDARDSLAALLGVRPHELIFTGGGTESNNLAILGLARGFADRGKHLVTASTEHHCVLHAFEYLARHEGFDLTILPVLSDGRIDPAAVAAAIRPTTTLVSILSANNETGVIQPIAEVAALCRSRGVAFHSDMVQTFGKMAVRPKDTGITAMSIAAHKFYGPKGAGLLYLESGISLPPLHYGGSHENQRRPGTENVAAVAGMAAAATWVHQDLDAEQFRQRLLRERLWDGIADLAPDAVRNSDAERSLSNTLNVSFPGADGEMLLIGLDLEGVAVSSGSACMVGSVMPSHVLLAMGVDPSLARATVRFSLGKFTTSDDIDDALRGLSRVLARQVRASEAA